MNAPKPQACHACPVVFVGPVCPGCGAERAAFTAMKNITAQQKQLAPCPYVPRRVCDCGNRGLCLDAA